MSAPMSVDGLKNLMEKSMLDDYLDEILVMAFLMDYEVEHGTAFLVFSNGINHTIYFSKYKNRMFALEMKFRNNILDFVELRYVNLSMRSTIKKSDSEASHHMVFAKTLEMLE